MELVKELAKVELNLSASSCKCKTLLHSNVGSGKSQDLGNQLLEFGKRIGFDSGEFPLNLVMYSERDMRAVIELMENAANLAIKSSDLAMKLNANIKAFKEYLKNGELGRGEPVLNIAIEMDMDVNLIKELVIHGAQVDTSSFVGMTPLHTSVQYVGDTETLVKELLRSGANVNAVNCRGSSPLFLALRYENDAKVVGELLKWGADIHIVNKKGETPLILAASECSNLDFIKELFEHGPDCLDPKYCNDLLGIAIENVEFAKMLIKYALIKFKGDHDKLFDLNPYKDTFHYDTLSQYLNDCIREINLMKTTRVK